MKRPTRSTVAGRTYLAIQALARRSGEPTDELLTRFVLERFLYRLSQSRHRERLILKGGMLLEVFEVRRRRGTSTSWGVRSPATPRASGR